jgi:hypothetical protein
MQSGTYFQIYSRNVLPSSSGPKPCLLLCSLFSLEGSMFP